MVPHYAFFLLDCQKNSNCVRFIEWVYWNWRIVCIYFFSARAVYLHNARSKWWQNIPIIPWNIHQTKVYGECNVYIGTFILSSSSSPRTALPTPASEHPSNRPCTRLYYKALVSTIRIFNEISLAWVKETEEIEVRMMVWWSLYHSVKDALT